MHCDHINTTLCIFLYWLELFFMWRCDPWAFSQIYASSYGAMIFKFICSSSNFCRITSLSSFFINCCYFFHQISLRSEQMVVDRPLVSTALYKVQSFSDVQALVFLINKWKQILEILTFKEQLISSYIKYISHKVRVSVDVNHSLFQIKWIFFVSID